MPNQPLISGSVDIAAPPSVVWSLISDLRRMPDWSPQCRKMIVLGKDVKVGTRTFNVNRRGRLYWPTNAKVVAFDPQRRLAFRIVENRTVWTYELDPTETGTRLTEMRTAPAGVSKVSNVLTKNVLGGTDSFEVELGGGIHETLERVKAAAEAQA